MTLGGPQAHSPDAVVIGSGPNGLVAANRLADAGWSVLVLEAQPEIGGAVRSDRGVDPAYVSDTCSSFYPLAAASPAMLAMGLEEYGVRWRHAPAVVGHPLPDGRWALLHRDRDRTAAWLDDAAPGDGEAWLELVGTWDRFGTAFVETMMAPIPPVRAGLALAPRLLRAGGLDLLHTLASPVADVARRFAGDLPGLLLGGNAAHADIPLAAPGSGMFGLMMTMLGQTVGFPVPEGGAGALSSALARRLRERGGLIECGREVVGIDVTGGWASGVRMADGGAVGVRRAVLADVSAPALFGWLMDEADVPRRVRRGMRGFRMDPGTVKVDWALDGPVPWQSPPAAAPGAVHVADSVAEVDVALGQVATGVIPARPFLIAGQMTTTDPTRSPAGTESMWAYAHVPQPDPSVRDADDGPIRGTWDHDDCERYADRMQARLERLAPGFGSRVRSRRVLGPHDLQARNANLIGGAIGGGTTQLQQELVFRPVPALRGRAETGIPGLYLASAAAHPGGGVHGACGANAARAALFHARSCGRSARAHSPLRTGTTERPAAVHGGDSSGAPLGGRHPIGTAPTTSQFSRPAPATERGPNHDRAAGQWPTATSGCRRRRQAPTTSPSTMSTPAPPATVASAAPLGGPSSTADDPPTETVDRSGCRPGPSSDSTLST